jgi:serine/threonine-protein phosphatase 2A regulatory subunit B'
MDLVAHNLRVILPLIIGALEETHWNVVVNGFRSELRKQLQELDPELFEVCLKDHREEESRTKARQEQRERAWKQLEELAATNSQGILTLESMA